MKKAKSSYTFSVIVAALVTVFALSGSDPALAASRKSIRWATAPTGTYGYKIAAQMVKILEDALDGEYAVTVNPYPSPTVCMKALMNGEAEISYTADVGITQFINSEGAFKNFTPKKPTITHTWYAYPLEGFLAVHTPKADLFKSWGDFSGKPVFFVSAGFMHWLNFRRIFKTLDYQFNHVEIATAAVADALQAGTIVGAVGYTTAGQGLPPWWREAELRIDVTAINPNPEEIRKLTDASLVPMAVDPKRAFSQDVGVKTILGVPVLFAYNVRADMPEVVVYKMVNKFYEERENLAKADPGFVPMARDFIGMQVQGINANPTLPVHPGLAKFLKEKKAWNNKWKIANQKP